MEHSSEYWAGYESMKDEIRQTNWETARDRFNRTNPPGQPWAGCRRQFEFAQGEYEALCDSMK